MIDKVELYKCSYCGMLYNTYEEAEECLNNHNIIFAIEENKPFSDCWGKSESNWRTTDIMFKNYSKAKQYDDGKDYRVVIKELK